MGRLDHKASTIQRCLEQMAQDGLQLQDLFTSLPLCKEEQAMLLRAVRKARPKFRPLPPGLQTQANTSPLLREIYEVSRPWPCGAQAGRVVPTYHCGESCFSGCLCVDLCS